MTWALRKDENMFSGQCPVAERQSDLSSRRVSTYRNACRFQLGTGEATGENRCATLVRRLVRISFTRRPKHVSEGQQMFDAGGPRVYLHHRDSSGSTEVTHIKTFVGCQTWNGSLWERIAFTGQSAEWHGSVRRGGFKECSHLEPTTQLLERHISLRRNKVDFSLK